MPEVQISAFKKLNILHKTLLMGQVLFIAIAVGLVASGTKIASVDKEVDKVLQVAVVIMAAGGFLLGAKIFRKKIQRIRDSNVGPAEKFKQYTAANIIQWAMLEAPTLLALVSFLLTGNYALIVLAAVLMVIFGMLAPSKVKAAFQLGLTDDEVNSI